MNLENATKTVSKGLQSLQDSELIIEEDLVNQFQGKINLNFQERTPEEIVEDLPTKIVPRGTSKTDRCPICWSNFEIGEELKNGKKCNHLFHTGCLMNWLRIDASNMTCPYCRNIV